MRDAITLEDEHKLPQHYNKAPTLDMTMID
jgi:hypothetical protein